MPPLGFNRIIKDSEGDTHDIVRIVRIHGECFVERWHSIDEVWLRQAPVSPQDTLSTALLALVQTWFDDIPFAALARYKLKRLAYIHFCEIAGLNPYDSLPPVIFSKGPGRIRGSDQFGRIKLRCFWSYTLRQFPFFWRKPKWFSVVETFSIIDDGDPPNAGNVMSSHLKIREGSIPRSRV
jgi:hypothetical protein